MNIYFLDAKTELCAQYHYDKHVVKMTTEYVQLLSNAVIVRGGKSTYKLSHHSHPCSKWVYASKANWLWLRSLVYWLNEEKKFRWGTGDHKSFLVLQELVEPELPNIAITMPPLCMPVKLWSKNPIEAYRNYYTSEKYHLRGYTKREFPEWMKTNE